MIYQVQFPKAVESISWVNQLPGTLHTIHDPRSHEFRVRVGVEVRPHTVPKILFPRSFVDVTVYVIICPETVRHVTLPLPYEKMRIMHSCEQAVPKLWDSRSAAKTCTLRLIPEFLDTWYNEFLETKDYF